MPKPEIGKAKKDRVFLCREAWIHHINEYQQSGLTQPEYAKLRNLIPATFRNWIAKLKRESQSKPADSATFVPVKVNPTSLSMEKNVSASQGSDLHIRLPNGIEYTFPSNHAPGLILP